ncbi:hypothetical protein E5288_WYG003016 [Bos mutus]|uniref:Dynein light intermediate chain n=1 Tax=Bos mutus TaxID=72004 RepID=A0A6B0RG66_9CETA|nr:hypothetical protein [Bos mutus]
MTANFRRTKLLSEDPWPVGDLYRGSAALESPNTQCSAPAKAAALKPVTNAPKLSCFVLKSDHVPHTLACLPESQVKLEDDTMKFFVELHLYQRGMYSHIRKFCLQYGAALIYASVKENKNIDLVYKYIVQKLYGFPYKIPAVVVEKDAVFIPAGWDNDKKIGILHENFQTLKAEDNFEDIITKPPVRKFVHEKEIMAEDDQVFLMKLQSLLAKQPPTAAGRPVDASPRVPRGSPRTPNRSVSSNVASVSPIPAGSKKIDPNMKAGATSEGVLANFFNSLLKGEAS